MTYHTKVNPDELSARERIFLCRLVGGRGPFPRIVSESELTDAFWGVDPAGGPVSAAGVVHAVAFAVRQWLARRGCRLLRSPSLGWCLEHEQLERVRDIVAAEVIKPLPSRGGRGHVRLVASRAA